MPLSALLALACAPPAEVPLDPPSTTVGVDDRCAGGRCVASPSDTDRVGWAEVAVADDGSAWVLYAEAEFGVVKGLWVTRSAGPGAPLSPPIAVPITDTPYVDNVEKPSIAVQGDRLAVAYTGSGGSLRHGNAHATYVQLGTWSGDAVTFDPPTLLDSSVLASGDGGGDVMEMARVAFSPAGEPWALWKRQDYGVSDHPVWARESAGFSPELVSEALPTDHDCSPPDFRFGPSGQPLLAIRSNVGGWLQTVVVTGTDGGWSLPVQVSHDRWLADVNNCPTNGPRVVELPDGRLVGSWIVPDALTWRMWTSVSDDGGATFSEPVLDHDDGAGPGENWVGLAAGDDGRLFTAGQQLDQTTLVYVRDEPLGPFEVAPLLTGDGEPMSGVEMDARAGRVVAVGLDPSPSIWLVDL